MTDLISVFEWVVSASIKTLPLILVMILLQRYGKKLINPTKLHILWLLVFLSLSVPAGWQFTPFNLNTQWQSENADGNVSIATLAPTSNSAPGKLSPIYPTPIQAHKTNENAKAFFTEQSVLLMLTIFWFAGITLILFIIFLQSLKYSRIKKQAIRPENELVEQFNQLKKRLNIKNSANLLLTDKVQSPITLGSIKPVILLPLALMRSLNQKDIENILLHELTHIKRNDIAYCWLTSLVAVLHWFNPFAWLALSYMRKNLELACDTQALDQMEDTQRKEYGETLITLSSNKYTSVNKAFSLGILENHTHLRERITMITQSRITGIKTRLTFVFTTILFAAAVTAQPQLENPDYSANNENSNSITLNTFVKNAENDLGTTILLSNQYSQEKIIVSEKMKKVDYGNFLSILQMNDYTALRANNLVKVIPTKDARSSNVPVVEPNGKYYADEYVTEYILLKKSCPKRLLPVLRPMVPKHSHLAADLTSGSMLITDTYANVQRIKKVVAKIESDIHKKENCNSKDLTEKS